VFTRTTFKLLSRSNLHNQVLWLLVLNFTGSPIHPPSRCSQLRVLGGSSSLEELSQVLTLVSALPLLLSFLGSAIVGQLSLKWPFSPHAKHPLFLCFFLSMLKRRSSTCRGTPIRLILRIISITFPTRQIVSSSWEDDVDG
jgi:hypothetical protein